MKIEINGKTYELVYGYCEDCVFHPNNGCILNIDNSCVKNRNYEKHWKEVKDEQNTNKAI